MKKIFRIFATLLFFLVINSPAQGQSLPINAHDFSNFAGQPGASGSADGTGVNARLNTPRGVAVDGSGNAYIADYYNNTIRKVTPEGVVTTLAGLAGTAGSTDGTGSAARFDRPYGIAVDGTGKVYVASWDNTIRKLTPPSVPGADWIVTTLASGFNGPSGVAVNSAGTLIYVADRGNQTIRKLTLSGSAWTVTTLAGQTGAAGGTDGTGSAARFYYPMGIALDTAGYLYVTDYQTNLIRKVTSTTGVVTTIAGYGAPGSTDGTGTAAYFNHPLGIAADSAGNLYVADQDNHTIRRLAPSGPNWVVTTMAGSAGTSGSADGAGTVARFNQPQGVAVDSAGTLFVADTQNHRITKGTPVHLYIPPTITTATPLPQGTVGAAYSQAFAATGGTPPYAWSIVSGTLPSGLSLSAGGAISGTLNETPAVGFTVQVTGADGASSTKAFTIAAAPAITTASPLPAGSVGTPYSKSFTASGGSTPYTWSILSGILPSGLTLNPTTGYLYGTPTLAANTSFTVKVTGSNGLFTTKAFSLTITPFVTTPAQLTAAVGSTYALTFEAGGGTGSYTWAIIAGSLPSGWSLSGNGVLTGTPDAEATFSFTAQATDQSGVSVTKVFTLAVRPAAPRITSVSLLPPGTVGKPYIQALTVQGGTAPYTWALISGSLASGLSLGGDGIITGTPDMETTTRFAVQLTANNGLTATKAFSLTVNLPPVAASSYAFAHFVGQLAIPGTADGTGSEAQFNFPNGLALDGVGNLYVADTRNLTIRKVTPAGLVTTVAGSPGYRGSTDGPGSDARFDTPAGIAVDDAGNLFVADMSGNTIRKITPQGVVTTIAGAAGIPGKIDGTGSEARFYGPSGVAFDGTGNLFVVEYFSHSLRKVTPERVVTIFAGSSGPGVSGSADGTGTAARFYYPTGAALDGEGNLYIADQSNGTIRKVTPAAVVTTFAGSPGASGSTDGTGTAARFIYPGSVAVDGEGNVFVTDNNNHTIRKITPAGVVATVAGSPGVSGSADGTGSAARFKYPAAIAVNGEGILYVADTQNQRITKGTPVIPEPVITRGNPLPDGMAGRAYHEALTAKGGTAPYNWSIVPGTGSLPTGLSLGSDGIITGTPGTAATADFTMQVTDSTASGAQTASKAFRLTVNPPLSIATANPLPRGTVGVPYQQPLTAGGGTTYYTWSIASGSLPPGLTLSGDGVISGTPESATTAGFTAQVTDIDGLFSTKAFSLAIPTAPVVTTASPLPAGAVGAAYSLTLTADGGTPSYTWSLNSGSLPPGLALSNDGVISGTPESATTVGFTAQVTDIDGLSSTKVFSLAIHLWGDVNGDGQVNLADAVLVMKVLSDTAAAPVYTDADIDHDERIGLPEAMYILQKAAGLR